MSKWKFFADAEVEGLDNELVAKLDSARHVADIPFVITSGLRTCAGNQQAMGADHSAHIKGLAVDLGLGHLVQGYDRDNARFKMVNALLSAGFSRIGVYDLHIHCDIGQLPDYAQGVIWQKAGQ